MYYVLGSGDQSSTAATARVMYHPRSQRNSINAAGFAALGVNELRADTAVSTGHDCRSEAAAAHDNATFSFQGHSKHVSLDGNAAAAVTAASASSSRSASRRGSMRSSSRSHLGGSTGGAATYLSTIEQADESFSPFFTAAAAAAEHSMAPWNL